MYGLVGWLATNGREVGCGKYEMILSIAVAMVAVSRDVIVLCSLLY